MFTDKPNIFQSLWYNMRLRILTIMTLVGFAIYFVFFLISTHTSKLSINVSRQFYADELQLLIAEQLLFAQMETPLYAQKDLEKRFKLILDKGPVYRYITRFQKPEDQNTVDQIKKLMKLAAQAQEAKNNIPELKRLYIESLKYTSSDVYDDVIKSISESISGLAVNQQIIFFTLIITFLLAFLALQTIAVRIGILTKKTNDIIDQDQRIDTTNRINFSNYDETAHIAFNLNRLMEILEESAAQSFVFIRELLYNVNHMFTASKGWKLEIQVMQFSTQRILHQIESQINSVNNAAAALEQMERTLDIIFNNISRQSIAMTESAATLEEMGRQVEGVAKISADTAELATNLTEVANKGNEAVDASIVSIRDVAEYSTQIIKLLQLITGIAKQTNLLAMNASIEAAHAGDAGRGFAIVAEEIRRLSETTNKNAKEIRTVVDTMVDKIENSVTQAQIAGKDLIQITQYAGTVEERIAQLNTMMQEQNTATHEMITTIEGLVNLAGEIKLSMEEQQNALHEYSNTISSLKENFSETKSTLDSHMSSVDNLLIILKDMAIRIGIQKDIMNSVSKFLDLYKIKNELIISDEAIENQQEELFLEQKKIHIEE